MLQTITLGGGCFWCTEAAMLAVKGVTQVTSGYAGGSADTANYDAVCSGSTAHVEVIEVTFDDAIIDLDTLLRIFFTIHDPTTLNRQGNDRGTQYASVIFYANAAQKQAADAVISELTANGVNVVTRLETVPTFYPAEDYHQNYYARNPTQGYCNAVIPPKLAKLRSQFADYFVG